MKSWCSSTLLQLMGVNKVPNKRRSKLRKHVYQNHGTYTAGNPVALFACMKHTNKKMNTERKVLQNFASLKRNAYSAKLVQFKNFPLAPEAQTSSSNGKA